MCVVCALCVRCVCWAVVAGSVPAAWRTALSLRVLMSLATVLTAPAPVIVCSFVFVDSNALHHILFCPESNCLQVLHSCTFLQKKLMSIDSLSACLIHCQPVWFTVSLFDSLSPCLHMLNVQRSNVPWFYQYKTSQLFKHVINVIFVVFILTWSKPLHTSIASQPVHVSKVAFRTFLSCSIRLEAIS